MQEQMNKGDWDHVLQRRVGNQMTGNAQPSPLPKKGDRFVFRGVWWEVVRAARLPPRLVLKPIAGPRG